MFYITSGKGFRIQFKNNYRVSVQFGPGNYCDHYDRRIGLDNEQCGREGSTTAECAVWAKPGSLIAYPDHWEAGDVGSRMDARQVLELLNWAAAQPEVSNEA